MTQAKMAQTRKQKLLKDVKKARRRRAIISLVVVAIIAGGVLAGILLIHPTPPNPLIGAPISSTTENQLNGVSVATLVKVGHGGVTQLMPETGSPVLTSGGKPEVLYIGADFCPYCAAERWSIIVALDKFGSFNGLTYMQSGDSPEKYPNTSTFSFYNATYASSYVSFVSVETADRNGQSLQPLTQSEQSTMYQFQDSSHQGSIPFVDVANRYVTPNGGSQYPVATIAGLDWNTIGSQLNNPTTGTAKAVDGAANTMIMAICNVDGAQPSSICGQTFAPPAQASSTAGFASVPGPQFVIAVDASSEVLRQAF